MQPAPKLCGLLLPGTALSRRSPRWRKVCPSAGAIAIWAAAFGFITASSAPSPGEAQPSPQEQHARAELAALDAELADVLSTQAQSSDEARQRAIARWLEQRAGRFTALEAVLAALADREERTLAQKPAVPIPSLPTRRRARGGCSRS